MSLPSPSALVLAALVLTTSAQAGAHEPATAPAPAAEPEPEPATAPAPATAAETATEPAPAAVATTAAPAGEGTAQRPVLMLQVGSGMVTAAIAVPASFVTASWLGTASGNNLIGLPALLVASLLPPVAVSLVSWAVGNWGGPARFRLSPAIWITSGLSVVTLVAAGFLGLNANEPGRVALYTAVNTALLPAAAVVTMQLTAAPPAAPAPRASLSPGEPRLPPVSSVPVVRFSF